jgi:hypothetical protein
LNNKLDRFIITKKQYNMTPQEKAKELVDGFTFSYIYFTNGFEGAKLNSKTCALIAVNEIIKELNSFAFNYDIEEVENFNYWNEVKQEIEKL